MFIQFDTIKQQLMLLKILIVVRVAIKYSTSILREAEIEM
jgi:hypothetical protein